MISMRWCASQALHGSPRLGVCLTHKPQASELAHEARASRVADRLKTADELAAETAAKLEELERRRLKRMRQRGSDDDASDDDADAAPKGGYAAKRLKRSARDADEPRKKSRKETVRPRATHHAACSPLQRRFY